MRACRPDALGLGHEFIQGAQARGTETYPRGLSRVREEGERKVYAQFIDKESILFEGHWPVYWRVVEQRGEQTCLRSAQLLNACHFAEAALVDTKLAKATLADPRTSLANWENHVDVDVEVRTASRPPRETGRG